MPLFAQRFLFNSETRFLPVAKVVKTFGDFLNTIETLGRAAGGKLP